MHLKSAAFYGILVKTQKIPDLAAEKKSGNRKGIYVNRRLNGSDILKNYFHIGIDKGYINLILSFNCTTHRSRTE